MWSTVKKIWFFLTLDNPKGFYGVLIAMIIMSLFDTIGIASTWLNAELLKLSFGKYAHSQIAQNPETKILFKEKILVGGGWKPGRSSDGAMVKYAETYKAEHIINLSNIDFVCDKDPNKFPNAKKLTNISWDELLKLTGSKWKPGANLPFDPTASKLAKKYKLKLIIANGKNLKNLKNIFSEKKFEGTTII